MYPDQDTYDKVNAYHLEFQTGALTSLRIPMIVEYYEDVEPEMVLKCIRVGNACDWNSVMRLPVGIMTGIEKRSSSEVSQMSVAA